MALPPSWKILNLRRSLAASHSGRGLDERQSTEVLAWLYDALVELERSAAVRGGGGPRSGPGAAPRS